MDFELNDVTRQQIKKNKKYFMNEIPNWEAFFEAVNENQRGIVAGDLYQYRDEIGLGNFLDYLKYLPNKMFYGSIISEIELPSNITEIGNQCFANCKDLLSCKIDGPVKEIPVGCFSGCQNLKEVLLPETVVKIGTDAFKDCTNGEFKIYSKKTGRNIRTSQGQIQFLQDHFAEV